MTKTYEDTKRESLEVIEEVGRNQKIQNALNKTLPNHSEETDYDQWLKGANKFASDNEDILKEWLK